MLKSNPNAYLYRHVVPGKVQNMGDWTLEEHNAFLETARQFGCGNAWGLFSSYVGTRVGYQCSNYYRSDVLPKGLVDDPKYLYSKEDTAHYAPKRAAKKRQKLQPSNNDSVAHKD